jgi:hypothetical protein
MKTPSTLSRTTRAAVLAGLALFAAGCLQERLAWSPNGRRAAVITADGLHLTDASGRITPLLVAGAYRAAWLPDSQRLVIARRKPAKDFAAVAAALGPDRTRALVAKAEAVGARIKDLPRTDDAGKLLAAEIGDDLPGVLAYLREQPHHLAALRTRFGRDWKQEDETKPVDLNEVFVARISNDTVTAQATLLIGLPGIHHLRPSPGGQAVALTTAAELSPHPDHGIALLVAPVEGRAPAVLVASQSTTHPDWTSDGRALVYFKATGTADSDDELRLGALVQRTVLDPAGRIALANESTDLAGLVHHQRNRVRCLRDGRLLFNASALTLPTIADGRDTREQLFLLTPGASPTLQPVMSADEVQNLPAALSSFELSPDDAQVLVAADDAAVWRITLATGQVEPICDKLERQSQTEDGENYPAPAWRAAGEFTYVRRPSPTGPVELVLRRRDGDEVLSRTWAPQLLRRLVE